MGRRRSANRNFWETTGRNNVGYRLYYDRLTELAISMFKWENLPDTIDERFLELILFSDGRAVFFNESDVGYLALRCAAGGQLNVYDVPTARRAYAANGFNRPDLNESNSVLIYNNMVRTNTLILADWYAQRLWDLDRTIDINAKGQKTPILVLANDKDRETLLDLYMQYTGNEPVIYGYKDQINPNSLKVLNTECPYVGDKLYQLKTQIWNEALTALGITNVSYQKKERMISDEVLRSQGGTIASRYSRLNARRQAVEKINKMFGLNIEVSFREDYREIDDENVLTGETGEGDIDTTVTDLRTNSPYSRGGN